MQTLPRKCHKMSQRLKLAPHAGHIARTSDLLLSHLHGVSLEGGQLLLLECQRRLQPLHLLIPLRQLPAEGCQLPLRLLQRRGLADAASFMRNAIGPNLCVMHADVLIIHYMQVAFCRCLPRVMTKHQGAMQSTRISTK